jgi:hypothetical protein
MSALAAGAEAFVQQLLSADSAGTSNESEDVTLTNITIILQDLVKGVLDVFADVYAAWQKADDAGKQIGHDFEQVEGDIEADFDYVVNTILPHSLQYLYGLIVSKNLHGISTDITDLTNQLKTLTTTVKKDDDWIDQTGKPDLSKLLAWMQYVQTHDQPAIDVLIKWLASPSTFGQFAAAPIVGPLIQYLAASAHSESRDNMMLVIMNALQEKPDDVFTAFTEWLVAEPA